MSSKEWQPGYNNFEWLREQSLDPETTSNIDVIENDERAFSEHGYIVHDNTELVLRLKQGTFYTTRATGHTVANIFVQNYKKLEHTNVDGFEPQDGVTVVDIGANEGYYTLRMAKGEGARIFAIEPNPTAFGLLTRNLEANHADGVVAVNRAIWKKRGIGKLNIIPQVTGIGTMSIADSSFMRFVKDRIVQIPVQTITLKELIVEHGIEKIDILKIDIEGGELELIKSNLKELKIVEKIVLEYHSKYLRDQIIALLEEHGFRLVHDEPDRDQFGDVFFVKAEPKSS